MSEKIAHSHESVYPFKWTPLEFRTRSRYNLKTVLNNQHLGRRNKVIAKTFLRSDFCEVFPSPQGFTWLISEMHEHSKVPQTCSVFKFRQKSNLLWGSNRAVGGTNVVGYHALSSFNLPQPATRQVLSPHYRFFHEGTASRTARVKLLWGFLRRFKLFFQIW